MKEVDESEDEFNVDPNTRSFSEALNNVIYDQQLNLIVNIFARDEDKAVFEEYLNRMKGIGLFVDTDTVKNKILEFGPIVSMAKI